MTLTNGKAIYETTIPDNTNTIILNRWFLMFIDLTPDTILMFLVTLSPTNSYYRGWNFTFISFYDRVLEIVQALFFKDEFSFIR